MGRRKYPVQPIVGVGGVVLHNGRVVLVKRGVEPGKGKWSIPGGVVELGEPIREAVVREVEEECGLKVELGKEKPLDVLDSIVLDGEGKPKYHFVLLQFLIRAKGENLKASSDVVEARWVCLDDVAKYDLTKTTRNFFREHLDELKKIKM